MFVLVAVIIVIWFIVGIKDVYTKIDAAGTTDEFSDGYDSEGCNSESLSEEEMN
jgi:hypothetical protein